MAVIILFGAIVAVTFLMAFVSGRRFGPLALALAAGAMLAGFWSEWLAVLIGGLGVSVPGLPNGVLATVIMTIAPLCLLLLGGPKYQKKHERVLAAVLIALVTAALLVKPLGQFMTLEGDALAVYKVLNEWWRVVVTAGLLAGLADVFMLHTVKVSAAKKKH